MVLRDGFEAFKPMKLKYLARPGIVAVLTLSCPKNVTSAVCGIKQKDFVSIACL